MNEKRRFITACAIAALSAGIGSQNAYAEDADEDKALAPLVMVLFDTSTSMDKCTDYKGGNPGFTNECYNHKGETHSDDSIKNCSNTRLTKAIAAISGTPKGLLKDGQPSPYPSLIAKNVKRPKQSWTCTADECHYVTNLYNINPNANSMYSNDSDWDQHVKSLEKADYPYKGVICGEANANRYKCTYQSTNDLIVNQYQECNKKLVPTRYFWGDKDKAFDSGNPGGVISCASNKVCSPDYDPTGLLCESFSDCICPLGILCDKSKRDWRRAFGFLFGYIEKNTPCVDKCDPNKTECKTQEGVSVESVCMSNGLWDYKECEFGCDGSGRKCKPCYSNSECTDPAKPHCDSTLGTCTGCTADWECGGSLKCNTATRTCVECIDDNQCSGMGQNYVCYMNKCVMCDPAKHCVDNLKYSYCEHGVKVTKTCAETDPNKPYCNQSLNNSCVECQEGSFKCTNDKTAQMLCKEGVWTEKKCPENYSCTGGECKLCDPTHKCNSDGRGYHYCQNGETKYVNCLSTESCVNGVCVECENGTTRCSGDGYQICTNSKWSEVKQCGSGMQCDDVTGSCATPCENGAKECVGLGYRKCMDHKWSDVIACPDGSDKNKKYCADGECVADNTDTTGSYCTAMIDNSYLSDEDIENKNYSNAYYDDGVIQAYMYSVKFGFAGMATSKANLYGYASYRPYANDRDGLVYGRTITDRYKTNSNGNNVVGTTNTKTQEASRYTGIRNASPTSPSPLLYPTVSDDMTRIADSNRAVIDSVRTYYPNAHTPSGPALADLWYMFGGDSPDKHSRTADMGMLKQYFNGYDHPATVDSYYDCRPKAVIFITDGEPSDGVEKQADNEHGHSGKIWLDAGHLYNAGIKVYTVGYAQSFNGFCNKSIMDGFDQSSKTGYKYITDNKCSASLLNYVAWKGGTCRNPITREIIDPDDEATFYSVIYSGSNVRNKCFYDANDGDALKKAMVDALSDMLSSFISKTRIATTTAISLVKNYDTAAKRYNNGYYNVYSGYEVTLGQVRKTSLQRETFTCDYESGEFQNDTNQYLDLAQRLSCQISGCNTVLVTNPETGLLEPADESSQAILKNAGYTSAPMPCAPRGYTNSHDVSSTTNTCLYDRYIFTGDYSEDRYQINPDPVTMVERDDQGQNVKAGFIKDGLAKDQDYHFLIRDDRDGGGTCSTEMDKTLASFTTSANYILSPYECGSDFDCGMNGNSPRYCDLGRCVDSMDSCTSSLSSSDICIANHVYAKGNDCNTHADCADKCAEGGCVCHAGTCVAGTVKGCDIRQFIATQPLGTIEYATPVTVAPPLRNYNNHSYKEFSKKYWQRDTMLMAGSNDGMLHAFILGDNGGANGYKDGLYEMDSVGTSAPSGTGTAAAQREYSEGDELWGFIPKTVLPNLYKLTNFGPQRNVNATPVVAEVHKPNYEGEEADSWSTVLVGGFRNGGRGFYALDISNPAKPKILWEIDHQWQARTPTEFPNLYTSQVIDKATDWANRDSGDSASKTETWYPFQLLGESYPEPVITNVLIDGVVEPVVIISGGESASTDYNDRTGHVVYIVRLFPKTKEDLLVKAFYFENNITGAPAVYPSNFNSIAQLLYVGDSTGALYRLDLSGRNPDSWGSNVRIDEDGGNGKYVFESPIFDPNDPVFAMGASSSNPVQYEKITFRPAVSAYKTKNLVRPTIQITFGSGANDNFSINETDRNYVANFYDVYNASKGKYELNPSNGTFSSMVYVFNSSNVADQNVTITNNDKFGNQKYHVYTHDPALTGASPALFDKRQKMTGAPVTHNFVSYFPTFIADAGTQRACATGGAAIWRIGAPENTHRTLGSGSVQNTINDANLFNGKNVLKLSVGTKVYGLEITNQMYCIGEGGSKQVAPQLIAQTGAETAGITSTKDGSAKLRPSSTSIQSVAINLDAIDPEMSQASWASVYE